VKVYVIVGVYQGVISSVAVRSDRVEAEVARVEFDKEYDIERDAEGYHENPENDVSLYECEVDGANGDLII